MQQLQSQGQLNRSERRELRDLRRNPPPAAAQSTQPPATAATPAAGAAQSAQQQRLQQLQSQNRLNRAERREIRTLQREVQQQKATQPGTAATAATQTPQQSRLQELQSKNNLSRAERREMRTLRREVQQQRTTQPGTTAATTAQTPQQARLQALQSKQNLTRAERRELRELRRQQDNTQTAAGQTGQQARIQELQSKSNLSRAERRELRQLQRDERRDARQQQPATTAIGPDGQRARAARTQAVTQQQAQQGRFAAGLRANAMANGQNRFAARRAARLAARTAWGLGLLAPYVPWYGPVYWPYAYNDVFYYTFWPESYDPGYWAYVYDDFFDGVFFPDGAPYVEYAAEGPYMVPEGRVTTGSAPPPSRPATPGRLTQATRDFCAEQAKGVTSWPLQQIADAVQPNEDQKGLLDDLRKASSEAAARLKDSCPDAVPMTPVGRLDIMVGRLQATDEAIQTVKPALTAFYNSLTDEQKARFNELGAQLGQPRQSRTAAAGAPEAQANCSAEKAGISSLAVNRIEQVVQPTETQGESLDKLDDAIGKAVDALRDACPNSVPQTPVGRLDVMQKRIEAMIQAAQTVRPPLDEFYASLSDEQKAKFNRLGRDTAQAN